MTSVKPLFRYAGNKAKLLKKYAPFFAGLRPEYCVDYCGGSGTMTLWFHQLYPEAKLYLNEIDPALYKLFKCIQEEYEEFMQHLRDIENDYRRWDGFESKKEFYYFLRKVLYNTTQEPSDEWFQAELEAHPEDYEEIIGKYF
jgi:site-specific DNA-adenine methylase